MSDDPAKPSPDPLLVPPSPVRSVYRLHLDGEVPPELPALEQCMARRWPRASPVAPETLEALAFGALLDAEFALRVISVTVLATPRSPPTMAEFLARGALLWEQRWHSAWERVRETLGAPKGTPLAESTPRQPDPLMRWVLLSLFDDEATRDALAILGGQLAVACSERNPATRSTLLPWELAQLAAAFEDLGEACRVLELVHRDGEHWHLSGHPDAREMAPAPLELLDPLNGVQELGIVLFQALQQEGCLTEDGRGDQEGAERRSQ